MLDALKIVAESWPLALVAVILILAIGISVVSRRASKASEINRKIDSQKELELARIKMAGSDAKMIQGSRVKD